MESKSIWPPLLVLLLAVGALFGFYRLERVDEANLKLVETKTAHATISRYLEDRRERAALLHQILATRKGIEKKKEDLGIIRMSVEADIRYIQSSMSSAIAQVIKDSRDQAIPVLELADGEVLREAKITRADATGVAVVHTDGIAKIDVTNLPKNLVERFDLGPESLQREIENLQLVVGLSPEVDTTTRDAEQQAYARKIVQLEASIERARSFKDRLEAEVERYEEQIKDAEANGRPTITDRSSRDVADGKAGDARNDLAELEQELIRLKAAAGQLGERK